MATRKLWSCRFLHQIHRLRELTLYSGLGVGTSPSALIAHGIQTTTIEIDPVVRDFATKYFNLKNHTSIIGDAITTVKDMQTSPIKTYDYIIHDVFTGGAEPLELFTDVFLKHLSNLLSHDGTIAIVCICVPSEPPEHRLGPPLSPYTELRRRYPSPLCPLRRPHHPLRLPHLSYLPRECTPLGGIAI